MSDYDNTGVNDRVTIDISDITSNTGIAKTDQFFTSSIINKNDYPLFDFSKEELNFSVGEKLSSNGIIRDLIVSESNSNNLKVSGLYKLSVGEIIVGEDSGTIATIESINSNNAIFDVKYSYLKNIGWDNDTGKLSENFQVIADNNYYQNLSYSIKSPITYRDQQSPVENLVHISGLKNFADTQIQKNTSAGLSTSTNTIATSEVMRLAGTAQVVGNKNELGFAFDIGLKKAGKFFGYSSSFFGNINGEEILLGISFSMTLKLPCHLFEAGGVVQYLICRFSEVV